MMAAVNAGAASRPAWLEMEAQQVASETTCLSTERGRALARLEVEEAVREIRQRAARRRLDRGLALSLPYFDDAAGELRERAIMVIPHGRVPFVPAFVTLAAEKEIGRVSADRVLTETTREHLLELLRCLADAFRS